ncbi:tripartite tricarboxylate transporter substrate binding protein [Sulfitobacter sp. S0837]|uniref:tripartite tricarboxylate transporter substrate-binding protein n=1 Tax=Sulfitobacter maritimus TaxID=2741719 RepID=UPI001581C0E1|nr:tripartite tricarboxylate transporter substrate-binding protein [Sulfitobacter maritimus]NUH63904.1 tripartite tricarboxylate transporter substrate binding protein [Sulfitobacter maritimus]
MKLKALGLAAATALAPLAALAEYPEKPVSFVVPWPPGDLADITTRIIADEFQATYDVASAVLNKPGGGGGPFPGAVYAAQQPADGYTVGALVNAIPAFGDKVGIAELNPNPFEPLGIYLTYPFVIAARGDLPFASIEELADYSQDNGVVLGHFGAKLLPTRAAFALAKTTDINFASHAAFDALDCNTLASGDADIITVTVQTILPCMDSITVLATFGDTRLPLAPDAPAVTEIVPDLNLSLWNGLFVHKDTPQEVRDRITEVAERAVNSERMQKIAAQTGALIEWSDRDATEARIESDKAALAVINELLQ